MQNCIPNYEVSVVIPTFNSAEFIGAAIESVLTQTLQNFELIVVDDGSTDNTRDIVLRYKEKDSRIKYFSQENSGGAARPKNVGIKFATGKYLAVLDADDRWMPSKLERQVRLFNSAEDNLGFVGCGYVVEDGSSKTEKINVSSQSDPVHSILMRDYMGPGSCIMYKREVFEHVGLFDENLKTSQDWEMRIRLAETYRFDVVKDRLVVYLLHKNNISKSKIDIREKDRRYIFNKYKHYYKNDRYLFGKYLMYEAMFYLASDEMQKARSSLFASMRHNLLDLNQILLLFFSFLGADIYVSFLKVRSSTKDFVRRVFNFVRRNFKHPLYTMAYFYASLLPNFRQSVKFYSTSELIYKLKHGFSLIRIGDGEISASLEYPMPYHDSSRELSIEIKKVIKESQKSKNLLVAVPRHLSLPNKKLRSEDKLSVWLPFKVFYFLNFSKKNVYADAHSFYSKSQLNSVIEEVVSDKNVIFVTKKETIDCVQAKVGLTQTFIPAPSYNAYEEYLSLKGSIEEAVQKVGSSNTVILIALGPVGKILAYHFYKKNIQCLDIGKGLENFLVHNYD